MLSCTQRKYFSTAVSFYFGPVQIFLKNYQNLKQNEIQEIGVYMY